jgi:YD repeat-containing protein
MKYDGAGRLTNVVDAAGTYQFSYTAAGRLASEDGPWADDTVTRTYTEGLRTAIAIGSGVGVHLRVRFGAAVDHELHTPTIATLLPTRNKHRNSFSATNAPQTGAKLAYIKLNIPMPCPPRSTVPVYTGAWFYEFVSSQRARFAFGQGCDCSSYVARHETRNPFAQPVIG